MSEDQKRELIRVTQLPVIEEQLKALSAEIDTKVNEAMSMVCTEDTVKAVKKVRAELNSQFWELEGQRKAVKKAIMGPYERFEQIYSKYISQKFKAADDNLKAKINETEDNLRQAKESELQAWTAEYIASVNVDFLRPEDAGIKVNLSSSMASLKKAAKEFVDRVAGDCAMIDAHERHGRGRGSGGVLAKGNGRPVPGTCGRRAHAGKRELFILQRFRKLWQQVFF